MLFSDLAAKEALLDDTLKVSLRQLDVASAADVLQRATGPLVRNSFAYVAKAVKSTYDYDYDYACNAQYAPNGSDAEQYAPEGGDAEQYAPEGGDACPK